MISDEEIKAFIARPRAKSWYAQRYTELRDAIFATMLHGIRFDKIAGKAKAEELIARKTKLKAELLTVTGGIKLWSEHVHRSEELLTLLSEQRRARERYTAIPKSDKQARKQFKLSVVNPATQAVHSCRAGGRDKSIEVGTGLSDVRIVEYLYTTLGLPAQRKKRKESGKITLTADDIALKKLRLRFPQHSRLIELILGHRKCNKLLSYLDEAKLDPDGRLRCQYKLAGTQSGRLASSENPLGTGTNLQNFDSELKALLLPDES